MTRDELLVTLRTKGIRLFAQNGDLHYRAPAGQITPSLLRQIKSLKSEIIDYLTNSESGLPPLVRRGNAVPIPLSSSQRLYWNLAINGMAHSLNTDIAYRVLGALDVNTLEKAFRELTNRHDILRTRFQRTEDGPIQIVAPPTQTVINHVALRSVGQPNRSKEALDLCLSHSALPIDLVNGPVFLVHLFQIAHNDHVLLIRMPHIVTDAWSLAILVQDFQTIFEAVAANKTPVLPQVEFQYADYAIWQNSLPASSAYKVRWRYWLSKLKGATSLTLPVDHKSSGFATPRPPGVIELGSHIEIYESLRLFCHSIGVTVSMGLHAATAILLSAWTGESDFVVNSVTSGRVLPSLFNTAGCFVSGYPMRVQLTKDLTFTDVAKQLSQSYVESQEHDLAGLWPISASNKQRGVSVNVLLPMSRSPFEGGLSPCAQPIRLRGPGQVQCDLNFILDLTSDRLGGRVEFDPSMLSEETIQRLVDRLLQLIQEMRARPTRRLSELRIAF